VNGEKEVVTLSVRIGAASESLEHLNVKIAEQRAVVQRVALDQ